MSTLPPPFEVKITPERSRIWVAPSGELDIATAGAVQSELDDLHANGWRSVVLDLRGLTFMDSTGLRLVLDERRRCQEEGKGFAIVDGPDAVERVLRVSGVAELLERTKLEP